MTNAMTKKQDMIVRTTSVGPTIDVSVANANNPTAPNPSFTVDANICFVAHRYMLIHASSKAPPNKKVTSKVHMTSL